MAVGNENLSLGPPLLGLVVGLVLFGVTLLQAYQYFLNYTHDLKIRKLTIAVVCCLDSLHSVFAVAMVYSAVTSAPGFTDQNVIWSMKGSALTKTFMIVLVQSFYLRLIWVLAGNIMLNQTISRVIKSLSLLTFLYAIGVAIAFLSYVENIPSLFSFSVSFEKMLYVAFGSTAVIDCGVAAVMSLVLVQTRSQASHTSTNVINYLVTFFVATGFLTAVAAVLTIVLYIVRPSTVLYLTVEFSVPKLYANSILAMFNAKSRMQKHMNTTEELKVPSVLFFGDAPAGNEEDGSS